MDRVGGGGYALFILTTLLQDCLHSGCFVAPILKDPLRLDQSAFMGGWRVLLYGVLRKAFARLFTLNAAIPVAGKPSRWN